MIKKTIYIYLFFILLSSFSVSFICSNYTRFLEKNGLDYFWMNVVNAIFFVTLFVCEIPTGVFADIFGRKISYVLSFFILSASMFVYSASDSFTWFVIAEIVGAVGRTFANGALDAWMRDSLDFHGCDGKKLKTVYARKSQFAQIAGGIGGLIGGSLAGINSSLPWIFSGTFLFVGGILAILLLKEKYFEKSEKKKEVSFKYGILFAKGAVKQGLQNKVICFVVAITLVRLPVFQSPNMHWPQFFLKFVDEKYLGCIFFSIALALVAGSLLAIRFLEKMKNSEKKFLVFSQILAGVGLILAALFGSLFLCLPAFLLHEFSRGLFAPIKDDYINQSIPEKDPKRATLLSIESMACHLGGVIGLILSGLLAKYSSIPITWIVFGGFLIIATLLISKTVKK